MKKKFTSPKRGVHRKPEVIFTQEQANDRLYDIFKNHGFGQFPHAERIRLAEFYHLLMTHQLTDNVTRLTKFRDVAIKHFIDSLIITRHTELMFPLLDIGTGAGFPGIPLKIIYPKDKIILAEGVRKRVDFLKAVRQEMKLEALDIIGRNIDSTFVYPVKGAITRAVEVVSQTLESVSQCLEIGGRVFLMKGPNVEPELRQAEHQWGEYFKLVQDVRYDLPQTPHQRRLVVYEKIKTPKIENKTEAE